MLDYAARSGCGVSTPGSGSSNQYAIRIQCAAESEETSLYVVPLRQMAMLGIATMTAAATELADPAYRAELTQWTHRPRWIRDGVPPEAAVEQVPRRVPLRNHTPAEVPGLPASWLRVLRALRRGRRPGRLAARRRGAVRGAPDRRRPRARRGPDQRSHRDGLPASFSASSSPAAAKPYLVVRVGSPVDPAEVPPVPRRDPAEVIDHAP